MISKENWLWLAAGLGYGAMNTRELLIACPTGPQGVLKELGGIKLDEVLTQKQAEKLASTNPPDYALMLNHAEAQGIQVVPIDSPHYPKQLHSITNPPLVLFVKGDVTLLNGQLCVGMVGARKPSGYGVEAMRNIGRGVALGGAIIVSGMAAGLDSEAHKAALAVNGPTIACIAFGHNSCYPADNKKLMELIERYGAVVSEYPPNQKPEKAFFLHRNRLIAGLSHALLVAEARKHSGTMSTVNFATDYGRDVFAVPGSVFSELSGGTNAMIREGAYLAACAADIMSLYGIELPEEDLSKLAAQQAKDGRPASASIENTTRVASNTAKDQTLLEAIQGRVSQEGKTQERVSRNEAIDAFRRLQNELPADTLDEERERNQALEEMVAAVSDDVVIQKRQNTERSARRLAWEKQLEEPKKKKEDNVKPFSWNGVERLTREDLQKSDQVLQERAKIQRHQQQVSYRRQTLQNTVPVSPVSAALPTAPVMPAIPVAQQATAGHRQQEAKGHAEAAATPYTVKEVVVGAQTPQPAQAAPQTQQVKPKQSDTRSSGFLTGLLAPNKESGELSGRLRTIQKPADEKAREKSKNADGFLKTPPAMPTQAKPRQSHNSAQEFREVQNELSEPRAEEDVLQTVSEAAQKAFEQLGVNPRSLVQIAQGSGLSSGEAMAALTELELAGLSRQLPGRQFTIVH